MKRICSSVLTLAFVSTLGAFTTACAGDELDDVREVKLENHVEDWRDEVIYQLVTDRFANGDSRNDYRIGTKLDMAKYQGGDWQGVIDRMDYLETLGVTALWISPIVKNIDTDAGIDGYHGYWQTDLERLNPHFGDLATLRRMINEAHKRDIKVVLDIVTNHLGQVFYYDINKNGRPDEAVWGGYPNNPSDPQSTDVRSPTWHISEYDPDFDIRGIQSFTSLGESGAAPVRFFDMPEIFRTLPYPALFQDPKVFNRKGRTVDWNRREQVLLGDFPGGLKDIDTTNPDVREEMTRVFVNWALKLDLDGFRIDTLKHVEHEFWQYFAPEVRKRLAAKGKTNFLMFGESFLGGDQLDGSYTEPGMLDSVFYFSQKFGVFNGIFMQGGGTDNVRNLYQIRFENYGKTPQEGGIGVPPTEALVNFIDNHDTARFLFENPDENALRAAVAYLFTEDGIPCLYYGTEQAYAGGNDPGNREPLWWSGYDTTKETFKWTSRMIAIRKQYDALRRGGFDIKWTTPQDTAEPNDAGIVAFEREVPADQGLANDYALVIIHAGGHGGDTALLTPSRTTGPAGAMAVDAPAGSVLVDVISGNEVTVSGTGTVDVTLDPYQTMILVPQSQYVAVP